MKRVIDAVMFMLPNMNNFNFHVSFYRKTWHDLRINEDENCAACSLLINLIYEFALKCLVNSILDILMVLTKLKCSRFIKPTQNLSAFVCVCDLKTSLQYSKFICCRWSHIKKKKRNYMIQQFCLWVFNQRKQKQHYL